MSLLVDEPQAENKLLSEVKRAANPTPGKTGRPAVARRRKLIKQQLRSGNVAAVDKSWLLEQLLAVHSERGIKAQDRLRALELMARISGYSGKDVEPEDERKALQDLMREMEVEQVGVVDDQS